MSIKSFAAGVVGAVVFANAAQAQQAVQWKVADGGNGHWYRWERQPNGITWSAARLASEQMGGYLATIHSGAENGFVFNLTLPTAAWQNRFGPWLGGYQPAGSSEPGGGWRWVTDEPWRWTGWLSGEPNNAYCQGLREDSLHYIEYGSGWNDLPGDVGFPVSCEGPNWSFVVEWSADCNSDGVVDYGQIVAGDVADTNTNGIPDCCEQGTPCFDADGDGITNSLDNCPTTANPDQLDCNNNGIGEACETFPDCNSNSLPDSCDITSGTSADADSNGIPDSCQPDCNLNNLPDAWEIATGRATDYNADGIPDTCQGAVMVDSTTDNLGAPSGLATREHSFTALPFAESAVSITIDLIGDLNGLSEYVQVSLNGGTPRRFFEADGNDCPATPDRAIITLTRAEFNALISPSGGTGAILVVSMIGSPGVDSSECKNAALTQFRLQYVGIQAKSGDCNGNNRLDIAETHDGTTPDCNLNTVPDSCDIARGAAQDCNLNGVPDACELATTPALDCNTNGIIDSCDLAIGGTTVDCDQNGRIDSCQVTETPGTDCNGNLRPDACDIAGATSGDIDHNGTPDECQTVTVPGQYADIQAAIDAAPASEMRIISVAAGIYAGPIAFNGKPVIVRGASAASTVIDGASGQTLSVVRFNGGEPAIAALERMTVRGGITGSQPSGSNVLVGGGIFGQNCAASVHDCVIENNAAGFGGGAYFLSCTGNVTGTTFRSNNASADGGGFQANQCTMSLTDVVVENNTCNSRGAGMHLVQGGLTLTRVTVRSNYSNNLIGGVSWYAIGSETASLAMVDCSVTSNTALVTQGGIGISASSTSTPTISLFGSGVCNNLPRPNITGSWTDLGGNTICDCVGDLTLDGFVNGADLGILLASWGACTGSCASDLNRDGVVNGADLGVLLAAWGACGG
jgi:hypothetical protein